ncbi:HinT-interacting membrane complex lipoprotein P60 [[Mycoplasma] gypis]|uniref:P60-like lipoprotein n=1 Tax=[Mycoplasma] gypis TaxID=92404 RepID=A0ABZ2RT80_9BACT|nr:hypothetical protein [[Mycoplasma] gypis]MBN0919547.1 hypothetical protein [[Mycoplasma] gypis]
MTKKQKLFFSGLAITLAAATPLAFVSCKNDVDSNKRGTQNDVLNSESSKNIILTTYANALIETLYKNDVRANSGSFVDALFANESSAFYKDFSSLFKIYAQNKLQKDGMFFVNLKADLVKKEVDVTGFNPNEWEIPSDSDMQFLFKNSAFLSENIRLEIEKMVVVLNYLLKNRSELQVLSKDNNKDKDFEKMSKDSLKSQQKQMYEMLDSSSNDLYLIKYLLDNNLAQSWNYERKEDVQLLQSHAFVDSVDTFNSLANKRAEDIQTSQDSKLILDSNDSIDVTKLLGYRGVVKYNSVKQNDMNYSVDALKNATQVVSGFVDPKTGKVYSQDDFEFSKILLNKIQNTPVVALKEASKSKTAYEVSDFEIQGASLKVGTQDTYDQNVEFNSKQYTVEYKLKLSPVKNDNLSRLFVTISIPNLKSRLSYDFVTEVISKQASVAKPIDSSLLPTYVNIFDETSKTLKGAYLTKIVPLAKDVTENGKTKKVFSLENTPWNSNEQKELLAKNIIFLDYQELYKTAAKYLQKLGLKISNSDTVVKKVLSAEGLL